MGRRLKALFAALLAVLWIAQATAFASQLMLTGAGLGGPATTSTSVIQSIQQSSITIANGNATGTATISSVTTSKAIVIYQGVNANEVDATHGARYAVGLQLTNGTTVTATRGGTTNAVTVNFTVIEFKSGVNSIQQGTIAVASASSSNTATISAVGANAFVLYEGTSTATTGLDYSPIQMGLVLTNSTTVTATTGISGASMTAYYEVVDLDSSIVQSVQAVADTRDPATATSFTSTITSVTTGQTLLFPNGETTTLAFGVAGSAYRYALTNATTVTGTRSGTATGSRSLYFTVVQFASAALNGSVQRGTIALSAATSNTATITSVTTSLSFANWAVFSSAAGNPNVVMPTLALTNATTVTAAVTSAGSPTVSYEVLQFL